MTSLLFLASIIITLAADYLLKSAANSGSMILFFSSAFLYGTTATCWYFILKENKLSVVAAAYSVCVMAGGVIIGCWCFGETLKPPQWFGICLAILAVRCLGE